MYEDGPSLRPVSIDQANNGEARLKHTSASDENRGYGVVNWGSLMTIVGGFELSDIGQPKPVSEHTHRCAHD